jgi:hypothetical protein
MSLKINSLFGMKQVIYLCKEPILASFCCSMNTENDETCLVCIEVLSREAQIFFFLSFIYSQLPVNFLGVRGGALIHSCTLLLN